MRGHDFVAGAVLALGILAPGLAGASRIELGSYSTHAFNGVFGRPPGSPVSFALVSDGVTTANAPSDRSADLGYATADAHTGAFELDVAASVDGTQIQAQGFDSFSRRPTVRKRDVPRMAWRALRM